MQTEFDKLLNAVNNSTSKWKKQGLQRRFSMTDLHGVEYQSSMSPDMPAQFFTSVSYDFDRFAHWWLKVIIRPMTVKNGLGSAGGSTSPEFTDSTYDGNGLTYQGVTLSKEQVKAIIKLSTSFKLLPSAVITHLFVDGKWGKDSLPDHNNWNNQLYTEEPRPSGVPVTKGYETLTSDFLAKFNSVDDFLYDFLYTVAMLRDGDTKVYTSQGKLTFDEYVRGLFTVGGATRNYSSVGYGSYLKTMTSTRNAINGANNNALNDIDKASISVPIDFGSTPTPSKPIDTVSIDQFPDDIKILIDGIDFTPMFKAQFGGEWFSRYAIYPNDKPNEGYDVMLSAIALTPEQQKRVFSAGEHLIEVKGSMMADVILRVYLKYNHLN